MCCAVLDVVQVVFVCLHADLAVSVLLVGDGLQQRHIVPVLHVIIRLNSFLQVFIGLAFSSFLDSVEILSDELLFSF